MSKGILITQCLQNDFVMPVGLHDQLPNSLHIGYHESKRLMGENPNEGMLVRLMKWAYSLTKDQLEIINIRDWHDLNDPKQFEHLKQFGEHCIKHTKGAEFVFEQTRHLEREIIINGGGLNDFIDTELDEILSRCKEKSRIGIIGVWTEAKVLFLAYELRTRFPEFEIAVCSAMTASSSTHMHFVVMEQMKKILGIQIISSVNEFASFLINSQADIGHVDDYKISGTSIDIDLKLHGEDKSILDYLFRKSKSVKFKVLDGGFSGNLVLKAESLDIHGHEEVATVIKVGARNPISEERDSFERIRDILGNNAPNIVDYIETKERAGIKYRYASMFDEKVTTFQNYYQSQSNNEKIFYFLDIVFKKQLGRFYKAATLEKIDLLKYYDFSSKYAASVHKKCETIIGNFDVKAEGIFIEGKPCFNLSKFYAEDLSNLESRVIHSHYMSYLHGDLNGANIIIDAQENVWLIDFFHTHRGHVLKDLIKLENDVTYIFMKIEDKDEFNEACTLIDVLISVEDLSFELKNIEFKSKKIGKAFAVIKKIRTYHKDLIQSDRSPYQLLIGLLRYSVHTLSFDECNIWQKKLALYASCGLAKRINLFIKENLILRIDPLIGEPNLGMTILPGRRDWKRNINDDVKVIVSENVKNVISLITQDEMQLYGVPDLLNEYKQKNLTSKHLSITDQGIPTKEEVKLLTAFMEKCLSNREKVLVHCVGGLGRTGLLIACYLKEYKKLSSDEAIDLVRRSRSPRAIESVSQEEFVKNYL